MNLRHVGTLIFFVGCFAIIDTATVAEYITVFHKYLENPSQMGEIAPMSKSVGKELIKYVEKNSLYKNGEGQYYLEAGGGAGAVSVCIVEKLRPQDHLDIVEINPQLCNLLRIKFKQYKNVSVHCCSVLDWHPGYTYDVIISTLPFLSLGIEFARQAIPYFQSVASDTCMFSCVEYPIVTKVKMLAYRLGLNTVKLDVQQYMARVRSRYLKEFKTVYSNIPPTNIYHLDFGKHV